VTHKKTESEANVHMQLSWGCYMKMVFEPSTE